MIVLTPFRLISIMAHVQLWGFSSVGRALEWHSRGQGFESPKLHQNNLIPPFQVGFFIVKWLKKNLCFGPEVTVMPKNRQDPGNKCGIFAVTGELMPV